jgi:hypothetical protein
MFACYSLPLLAHDFHGALHRARRVYLGTALEIKKNFP